MKLTEDDIEIIGTPEYPKNDEDKEQLKQQILQNQKLRKLVEEQIKECKQNAGGQVYGEALQSLLKESEK